MAEYYYFAATLPMLSMDREAPITYSAFMEQAKAHLTRRDYSDLEKAVMAAADGDAKLPLVRAWQAYAGRIRRLMNSYRAARLGFPGYEAREGGGPVSFLQTFRGMSYHHLRQRHRFF